MPRDWWQIRTCADGLSLAAMNAPDLPPTDSIWALVRAVLEQRDFTGRSELLAQVKALSTQGARSR